jgi:CheY-like chemotaxis protein
MAREGILIVDDNSMNLRLVQVILRTCGLPVRTATDAGEALASIEAAQPRLILMDLQLPGMSGLDLTRRLKADPETRGIIVVALTAYAMKGDEDKARLAGCDEYLTKPLDKELLRETIARLLAGPASGA